MKTIRMKMDKTHGKPPVVGNSYSWAVTGTFHGSIVEAKTEGEARRIFHSYYNGESILSVRDRGLPLRGLKLKQFFNL